MKNKQFQSCFNDVFEKIRSEFESFNKKKQKDIITQLDHGRSVISTHDQLNAYFYSYGKIHQAKLEFALDHLPKKMWAEGNISVVDYGCGQGIAELVLFDFLCKKLIDKDIINDLTLIDPSVICLRRCTSFSRQLYHNATISTLCKKANHLSTDDINPQSDYVLHILSNVLDIEEINIQHIANLLNNDITHNNIIMCVSPFYQENSRGKRMETFSQSLRNYHSVYKFQKHTDEWQHDFSCQINILISNYY